MRDPDGTSLGAIPTAMGGVTRLAYARAQQAGIPLAPLLEKAGLTEAEVLDHSARIEVRHQIDFLNLVAPAVDDPFLGFHLAQGCDLRALGLLYYVWASSRTLGDALRRGSRYTLVVNEGLRLRYVEGRDGARGVKMVFDYVGVPRHIDRHQMEFGMTALVRMCRQLTGRELAPSCIQFTHHRSEDAAELSAYFGCAVQFGAAADQATVDPTLRDIALVTADSYLNELLIAYGDEALAQRAANRASFRSQVENAMMPLLPHGSVRAGEIAKSLGVSQRTLARRLAVEGVTFSEVLEGLRSDLARQYLSDGKVTVSQVAWLLGYQEISAFTHAFKRWTGKTPREARTMREEAAS